MMSSTPSCHPRVSGHGILVAVALLSAALPSAGAAGQWQTSHARLPSALGEVAAGIVGDRLYVVGHGRDGDDTFVYDLVSRRWSTVAPRPFRGDHHALVVVGRALLVIGGLGGTGGMLQRYDVDTGAWTHSRIPWSVSGSLVAAAIGTTVFVCGGIRGGTTISTCGRLDARTMQWGSIASMPFGVNHAAAGTDGNRFFVFGGRDGPNALGPGFAHTQIYDPASNTWASSLDSAVRRPAFSFIPRALAQRRGGMGAAPFIGGEFYVIGGETNVQGPSRPEDGVYSLVSAYNPATNRWREAQRLPFGMHGIYPVTYRGAILLAGGGVRAGFSESASFLSLVVAGTDATPRTTVTDPPATTTTTATTTTATTAAVSLSPSTEPAVCAGRCGGYSASAPCQCDGLCTSNGDCCADYTAQCVAPEPTTTTPLVPCQASCRTCLPGGVCAECRWRRYLKSGRCRKSCGGRFAFGSGKEGRRCVSECPPGFAPAAKTKKHRVCVAAPTTCHKRRLAGTRKRCVCPGKGCRTCAWQPDGQALCLACKAAFQPDVSGDGCVRR